MDKVQSKYYLLQTTRMPKGKQYESATKITAVKELIKGSQTQEQICIKYGVSRSALNKWKKQFDNNAYLIFEVSTPKKPKEDKNPEYLTGVIGKLTVENDILKKALGVWN